MSGSSTEEPDPAAQVPDRADEAIRVISFEDLAEGKRVVVIEHRNQHYRLQLTKSGRLILTK